jgi:hypothetical protein
VRRGGRAWPDTSSRGPDSTGRTSTTTCGARARRGTHARPGPSLLMPDVRRPPSSLCWLCRMARHPGGFSTRRMQSASASRQATRPLTCAACSTSCAHAAPPSTSRCTSVARHKPCVRACGRHCKHLEDAAASPAHRRTRRAGALQPRWQGAACVATWCLDGRSSSCRMKALHARQGAWTAASACALAAALRLTARHAL